MEDTTEAAAPEAGTADEAVIARHEPATNGGEPDPQETEAQGDGENTAETEEIEEIELSFGAKSLKVAKNAIPDDVREALEDFTKNVQGDYTRKTQELAEQRKAAEEKAKFAERVTSLKGEALESYAKGQAIAKEIAQLEDFIASRSDLWQSDPDQARRISDALVAKRVEFDRTLQAVAKHESEMVAEEQRATAALLDAGRLQMAKMVKGFDAKAEAELIEYAVKNYGVSEQDAKRWPLNPAGAAMAWKAMQYDKLQQQTKAATAAKPPAPPAAPVKALSGRNAATAKDPEKMTDAEWVAWRNQQLAKKRA